MKVYTNIKTLKQVKRVIDEIGLSQLLGDSSKKAVTVGDLVNKLLDDDKLVELLQIITNDDKTDFEEMEAEKVGKLINDFFTDMGKFVPDFLRKLLLPNLQAKTSS